MADKPMRIFRSPITGRYYATRSYRVRYVADGQEFVEITGTKYDVTDDIETIVAVRIEEAKSNDRPQAHRAQV